MADWLSLVVPAAAALSGVGLTQWAAARQVRARTATEDRARSWEHRRAVYFEFQRAFEHIQDHIHGNGLACATQVEVHRQTVYNCLNDMAFFGTAEAYELANKAWEATYATKDDQATAYWWLQEFVKQARRDLQVPD